MTPGRYPARVVRTGGELPSRARMPRLGASGQDCAHLEHNRWIIVDTIVDNPVGYGRSRVVFVSSERELCSADRYDLAANSSPKAL